MLRIFRNNFSLFLGALRHVLDICDDFNMKLIICVRFFGPRSIRFGEGQNLWKKNNVDCTLKMSIKMSICMVVALMIKHLKYLFFYIFEKWYIFN